MRGGTPLMVGEFAGKTGFSEPPPVGNRDEWAHKIKLDLTAMRSYVQAVYAATDACLAEITDVALMKETDLSALGFGTHPLSFVFDLVLLNVYCHTGEISCIKGLQGQQGYPA